MKNIKKLLFYIAYTLVAVGCFLYFLFPSEMVKGALSGYLLKKLPAYQVQIDGLKPVLPLGFGFESVTVSQDNRPWVKMDTLKITPRFATLLSSRKIINFRGAAYQGDLRGHMELDIPATGKQTDLFFQLSDMQLSDMAPLQERLGRKLTGFLNGTVAINDSNGPKKNIKGKLDLTDVRFEMSNPIIKIQEVTLNLVEADFNITKQVLSLKRLEAQGGQLEGNLSGTVMLRKPVGKSRINLRGSFLPQDVLLAAIQNFIPEDMIKKQAAGNKGIPIRIYGTIDKPRFSFR